MDLKISEKKQKLMDDYKNQPLEVGEEVYIIPSDIDKYGGDRQEYVTILEINGDDIIIKRDLYRNPIKIKKELIKDRRGTNKIGANPFVEKYRNIRAVNYSMESIIFSLELVEKRREEDWEIIPGVKALEVNWNPFVYDKDGNKQRYQRGFVWTTEQKQLLIESIYKGISCGAVLIRKRTWGQLEEMAKAGERELYFVDIVDGKQRMDAIRGFLKDEYPDMYGNYFSDLSNYSQYRFTDHQLFQYAEMENVTDEETLYQFLKMNHEGVPQSKEHLDFVAKLLNEKQS